MRTKRRLLTLFVAMLAIAALAILSGVLRRRPPTQHTSSETTQIDQFSTADNLALQAKCYEQARSLYDSLGYPKGRVAGFGNHYNQKLGKCFLDVMNMETAGADTLWMHDYVLETVTGAEYAAYTALVPSRNPTPVAPPSRCEVRRPSGELRICGAEEEFVELINVYMEEE